MNGTTIIPSNLRFKSAPSVDQQVPVSVDSKSNEITEYDRMTVKKEFKYYCSTLNYILEILKENKTL